MLSGSTTRSHFDFWEFVVCGICQLPFSSTSGPTIPFWLTECGHIACNKHLGQDRTCMQCGGQQIQLRPLQVELDPPMSDWFLSLPDCLEALFFTSKFQLHNMAGQIRHFKSRYQRQKALIDRLKREYGTLKQYASFSACGIVYTRSRTNEDLSLEVMRLRLALNPDRVEQSRLGSPSQKIEQATVTNGKRILTAIDLCVTDQKRLKTSSSPRSVAPDRITLPQGMVTRSLTNWPHEYTASSSSFRSGDVSYPRQAEKRLMESENRAVQNPDCMTPEQGMLSDIQNNRTMQPPPVPKCRPAISSSLSSQTSHQRALDFQAVPAVLTTNSSADQSGASMFSTFRSRSATPDSGLLPFTTNLRNGPQPFFIQKHNTPDRIQRPVWRAS